MAKMTYSLVDHNRESSTVSLRIAEPDISGDAATAGANIQAFNDQVTGLRAAVDSVSLGLGVSLRGVYLEQLLAAPTAAAADENAQRERKWLVRYYDSVTFATGTFEVPAADLALLLPNSEYMNISSGPGNIFRQAVEQGVISKQGNPIVVTEVVHVGRNS